MKIRTNPYKRHRFPTEIIQYAIWLYYRQIKFGQGRKGQARNVDERHSLLSNDLLRKRLQAFGQTPALLLTRRDSLLTCALSRKASRPEIVSGIESW